MGSHLASNYTHTGQTPAGRFDLSPFYPLVPFGTLFTFWAVVFHINRQIVRHRDTHYDCELDRQWYDEDDGGEGSQQWCGFDIISGVLDWMCWMQIMQVIWHEWWKWCLCSSTTRVSRVHFSSFVLCFGVFYSFMWPFIHLVIHLHWSVGWSVGHSIWSLLMVAIKHQFLPTVSRVTFAANFTPPHSSVCVCLLYSIYTIQFSSVVAWHVLYFI